MVKLGHLSSDDDKRTPGQEIPSSSSETSSFVGRRVISNYDEPITRSNTSSTSSSFQQLTAFMSKIESQYLRPILIAQERLETMAKSLNQNQRKMAKALRKSKVNIQLTTFDEPSTAENDQVFLSSLMHESVDGVNIDLLKQHGVKENANLYVTALIDLLYRPQDLIALEASTIKQDERYLVVKDAVKKKFRLNSDELDTMWEWLHTVFLAKRRTLKGKYGAAP